MLTIHGDFTKLIESHLKIDDLDSLESRDSRDIEGNVLVDNLEESSRHSRRNKCGFQIR